MKISVKWSADAIQVYAIIWSRYSDTNSPLSGRTLFSILEDDHLTDIYEHECDVFNFDLDDFCMMPKDFDDRFLVLMWKPLAESGCWRDLREFKCEAIKKFREMRSESGHTVIKNSRN